MTEFCIHTAERRIFFNGHVPSSMVSKLCMASQLPYRAKSKSKRIKLHPYPCIRKWVFPGRLCHFLISGGYFTVQGLISYGKFRKYKTRFKCKTRFKYKNLRHSPYGPWPIWAKAHMGPGPLGPGRFLVGQTPQQKTHPGKKSPNQVFCVFV